MECLQDKNFKYKCIVNDKKSDLIPWLLFGRTCDGTDIISLKQELPNNISSDDVLIFSNTGAYSISYESNFNGIETPKVIYIKNGKLIL
jgi:ornithine decarboxylase